MTPVRSVAGTTITTGGGKGLESALIRGYGLMGRAVAGIFRAAGLKTTVQSSRAAQLAGSQPGVEFVAELPEAPPDLFHAPFLLGTGTSGLDLNVLADGLRRPERLVAVHFYMLHKAYWMITEGIASARELQKLIAFLDRETFPNTARLQPKARAHGS